MDGAAMLAALRARFGSGVIETHDFRGDHTAVVTREALPRVLAHCRDEPALAFEMLTDLTAVDYSKYPGRETARASRSSTTSIRSPTTTGCE